MLRTRGTMVAYTSCLRIVVWWFVFSHVLFVRVSFVELLCYSGAVGVG